MTSRQAQLKEDTDFRILRILQRNPEISQRDLAKALGMSLGGLNYCLKALIDKGFVKLSNYQNSKHKFKYVYILTPTGIAQKVTMTGRFIKRKILEYEALKAEINELSEEMNQDNNPGLDPKTSQGQQREKSLSKDARPDLTRDIGTFI